MRLFILFMLMVHLVIGSSILDDLKVTAGSTTLSFNTSTEIRQLKSNSSEIFIELKLLDYIRNDTAEEYGGTNNWTNITLNDGANYTICSQGAAVCSDWDSCTQYGKQYRSCADIASCRDQWTDNQDCDPGDAAASTGGGGIEKVFVSDECDLAIVKPTTKKILILGNSGAASQDMIFYNDASKNLPITFKLDETLESRCNLASYEAEFTGKSTLENSITCMTGDHYKGVIIIDFGDGLCETEINVEVDHGGALKRLFLNFVLGTGAGLIIILAVLLGLVGLLIAISKAG